MRRIFSGVAALVTAAVAVVAMSGAVQAKPADGDWQGCPYGAVCIYGQNVNPWAGPHPTVVYWSYGAHNLSGQYGSHWFVNNQYGGAGVSLCTGYDGAMCHRFLDAQYAESVDPTSYNSITLNR
ncbi:hypothetical protein ACFRAI_23575 [Streptomyces sp. NPDC056637]|uniref:hypothetical protein n=1 Tax=unclassified Streptomyces TaxID=2593676 RepID=UPI0036A25C84